MHRKAGKFVAVVVVVAELVSVGAVATSASAQSAAQTRQQIKRQQQLILQQQKQIQDNQRRIESQQAQLAAPNAPGVGAPAPRNIDRGIFGNIGNCPLGWTYSLLSGCLPAVVVVH